MDIAFPTWCICHHKFFINYFVVVFTSWGKWLGWNMIQRFASQMKTFYISIKFIVAFYVNMLQQLHLPVNRIANNNVNSTELKRKLDWCLELISVMWKWNTGIASSFLGDIHLICSYSRGLPRLAFAICGWRWQNDLHDIKYSVCLGKKKKKKKKGYRIKKSEKDVVYFQPEENHKTRIAKSKKF